MERQAWRLGARWVAAAVLVAVLAAAGSPGPREATAAEGPGPPAIPADPTRRINDYAGVLTAAERERLEARLVERERTSSSQVVVAVFRSLGGENLEDYAIRLAQAWRIGQKGLDNGVIVLVFLDDHRLRLEVGYGLEARLTDAIAGSIIRDVIAPRFRAGEIAGGIEAGLDAIAAAIAGTYQRPAGSPPPGRSDRELVWLLAALGLLGLIAVGGTALALVQERRSRRRGWTGSRRGWGSPGGIAGRPGGRGWSPGGFSPSGGSSPGGFGGGGGSFGGGGASGSW